MHDVALMDVQPGDTISIPGYGKTTGGLVVARVVCGRFKSYLRVSFKGGVSYNLPRDTVVHLFHSKETNDGEASDRAAAT